jgi:DNA replication protein DnaC
MGGLAYERLHANLEALKLNVIGSIVDNYLELAAKEDKPAVEVLDHLLDEEVRARNASAVETRLKLAGFPARKTLDDFDLSFQPSIDPAVLEELRTLRFIHNAESVCFLGPPGVGKTHLAIGLGMEAASRGFSVYYTTASSLLDQLRKAEQRDGLDRKLKTFGKYKLLVIDEIGYLPMKREGAHLFFQLVSRRYEKASTIFTSNKPFSEWGEVMGDPVIAAATLDRILHHSTTVNIKGESFRLRARQRAGKPAPLAEAVAGGGDA